MTRGVLSLEESASITLLVTLILFVFLNYVNLVFYQEFLAKFLEKFCWQDEIFLTKFIRLIYLVFTIKIHEVNFMLLIKKTSKKESEKLKLTVDAELLARVQKYCDLGEIEVNDFFVQAAEYILKKDKEFRKYEEGKGKK